MQVTNYKIPRNWRLVSLANDLPFLKTGVNKFKGKKKYFSTGSIKDDAITSEGEYSFEDKPSRANRIVAKGDVLQARMKNTDKAILVDSEFDGQLFSTGFFQIRADEVTQNNKYIYYFLKSPIFKKAKDELCSGSTQSALNDEGAKKIFLPLPSYEEQIKIVLKIEELFSELDKVISELTVTQRLLNIYRQSLLKWAFIDNKLSKSILKDVTEKIQIGPFGTQLHKEDYVQNGIPLINPMHIKDGKIEADYSYSITIDKRNSLPNYILKEGDVIMGRRGEMGRCGLVGKKESGWFCGTGSLYFRADEKKLNSLFLYHYLSSQPVKKYLDENAGGTTMANLNLKIVNNIPISLPSLTQQKRIVDELESKLSECDRNEQTITIILQQTETLRQSILKKAFEGELV